MFYQPSASYVCIRADVGHSCDNKCYQISSTSIIHLQFPLYLVSKTLGRTVPWRIWKDLTRDFTGCACYEQMDEDNQVDISVTPLHVESGV